MTIEITALFVAQTAERLLQLGLEVAQAIGLPVTSWRSGDPTRSLYRYMADALAAREQVGSEFIRAGFLSTAEGDWKTVVASETYGVERTEAVESTPTATLTNAGGGFYEIAPGDLTLKASSTGATFHNTTGGTLSAGVTLAFSLIADEAGSAGTVAANEIDELVTTLLGVSVVSSTYGVGTDAQSDDELEDQCNDTLGALSPNGPADAYEYVAKNSALTGVTEVNRARSSNDSTAGTVSVHVASASGAVSAPSLAAIQDALEQWATPLCVTPTALSATPITVSITATIHGEDIPAGFASTIATALAVFFAQTQIGEAVYRSAIIAAIHGAVPEIDSVVLSVPAADAVLVASEVPVLGTVAVTEV